MYLEYLDGGIFFIQHYNLKSYKYHNILMCLLVGIWKNNSENLVIKKHYLLLYPGLSLVMTILLICITHDDVNNVYPLYKSNSESSWLFFVIFVRIFIIERALINGQ